MYTYQIDMYLYVEDRIRRYCQSPVTHANHEETSTNVRSTRSAIYASIDGLHNGWRSGIQTPNAAREQMVLYYNDPCSHLPGIYRISPCETRGRFCGGPSLPHIRKKTARQGLGQTGPSPRRRRHHPRRRPLYIHTNRHTGSEQLFWPKKRKQQHPWQGDDASTAEAAPGRVGRGEQGEPRRANRTPNGGPRLELGRLRLKSCSKSDFSIAETTYLYIYLYIMCGLHVILCTSASLPVYLCEVSENRRTASGYRCTAVSEYRYTVSEYRYSVAEYRCIENVGVSEYRCIEISIYRNSNVWEYRFFWSNSTITAVPTSALEHSGNFLGVKMVGLMWS